MKREREDKSPVLSSNTTLETRSTTQRHCPREFFASLSHPVPENIGMHYGHSPNVLRTLTQEAPPMTRCPYPHQGNTSIPPELLAEYRRNSTPMQLPYYPPPPLPHVPPIPFVAVPPFASPQDMDPMRIMKTTEKSKGEGKDEGESLQDQEKNSMKRIWPVMGFGVMDIREKSDSYIIALDLPGIQKEDIDVSLKPAKIVVECIRKEKECNGYKSYAERPFGKLIRTIQLPLKANPESISCKYEDGVLIIQIGKLEELNTIKKVRVE